MLMFGETCELKTCSRCRCTLVLVEYFEKNRKGEYYKLCNGCRGRGRTDNEQFRERHYWDYGLCDKCGNKYSVNRGLSTHQRTWLCAKSELGRDTNLDDFYKWILDNKDNLLSMYQSKVPSAEAWFMQKEDKQ